MHQVLHATISQQVFSSSSGRVAHPFALAHRSTSACRPFAAAEQVCQSQSQPFALAHCSASSLPRRASVLVVTPFQPWTHTGPLRPKLRTHASRAAEAAPHSTLDTIRFPACGCPALRTPNRANTARRKAEHVRAVHRASVPSLSSSVTKRSILHASRAANGEPRRAELSRRTRRPGLLLPGSSRTSSAAESGAGFICQTVAAQAL